MIIQTFYQIGSYVIFFFHELKAFRFKIPVYQYLEQCHLAGVRSILLILLSSATTGVILSVQGYYNLSSKGLADTTGIMVSKSILPELAPLMTAIFLIGRSGASVTAELATMKISSQIAAYRTMSVPISSYIVLPRILAFITVFPVLTAIYAATGIFSAYCILTIVYGFQDVSFHYPIKEMVMPFDFYAGLIKSIWYALMISTISCYYGLKAHGGSRGVGSYTTRAVVSSYITLMISNFFLTLILNYVYTGIYYGFD
ncbi:ABC transporter permease [Chlamydiia bacterium]|nr:ABC transporter permease [Chlamydiia bacterium]MDA8773894.1 ABC transporter permease [Chlamydiia bacterium]